MKKRLKIKLTPRQMSKLQPLFKDAHEAAEKGEKGMVLFQANEDGNLSGLFFPMRWSEQMIDVAKDYRTFLGLEEDRRATVKRSRG